MKQNIEHKLKNYIKRLYQYKALEGFVLLSLFFAGYSFLYLIVESFFYLSTFYRTFFLYFLFSISIVWIFIKIIFPFVQSFVPKFQINLEEASKNIGRNNSAIDDKLLNLLQLKEKGSGDLVLESIKQLESNLIKFNFLETLNLSNLRLFFKLLFIPISFLLLISLLNFDEFIVGPSKRIISYNQKFKKPLDFQVKILNDSLSCVKGHSFKLKYKVFSNSSDPIYIFFDNNIFNSKIEKDYHIFEFKDVDTSLFFRIGENFSDSYTFNLKLIYPPVLNSLSISVTPPRYTSIPTSEFTNLSDVKVPEGSFLKWNIFTINTSDIILNHDSVSFTFDKVDNHFSLPLTASETFNYKIFLSNNNLYKYISLDYQITSIPDAKPTIDVTPQNSSTLGLYNFSISGSDDYGLTSYGYRVLHLGKVLFSNTHTFSSKSISQKNISVDTRNLNLSADAVIQFFIKDNDGINGFKTSYSTFFPLRLLSTEEIFIQNNALKDSLLTNFADDLHKIISSDSLNNSLTKQKSNKNNEFSELHSLKRELENSIDKKQLLIKNLNSINDKKLLNEIKSALADQEALLKQVNESLSNKSTDNNQINKSEELKAKNDFQNKKTLNTLRKIAASQLLKSLSKQADNLNKEINNLQTHPTLPEKQSINKQLKNISDDLKKYSKIKGSNKLEQDVQKELNNLEQENNKNTQSDISKMKSDSKKIKSLLKSSSTSMGGSGESMSVDLELLDNLFQSYLSLSKMQEFNTIVYTPSNIDNHFLQFELLQTLSFLNYDLYNFALSNKNFTRSSFDLIYPLQLYEQKFDNVYDSDNSYTLNKLQRELLSDLNSVTDLLSDIIEQIQNSDINSSSGAGNERKQGTPQELIEQQKQLNSQLSSSPGSDGNSDQSDIKNGDTLSDEQISEIIKRQEEIRNKFNQLNGSRNSKINNEIDSLKKSLLTNKTKYQAKQHQSRILKYLKDFKGKPKEKSNKRKSYNSNYEFFNDSTDSLNYDIIEPIDENLRREYLDFNHFYNNKIINIQ